VEYFKSLLNEEGTVDLFGEIREDEDCSEAYWPALERTEPVLVGFDVIFLFTVQNCISYQLQSV